MSNSYIGSKISLISKAQIRYEGTLYTVDADNSTITLSKVRTFGTENRQTDHPMSPRNDIYEYIIFKATDIKDILVCETAQQQPPGAGYGVPFGDPAIVSVSNKTPVGSTAGGTGSVPPGGSILPSDLSAPTAAGPKFDSRLSSPLSPANQSLQNKAPGAGRRESSSSHTQQQQQYKPHAGSQSHFYSSVVASSLGAHHQQQAHKGFVRRDEDVESVDESRSRASFGSRDARPQPAMMRSRGGNNGGGGGGGFIRRGGFFPGGNGQGGAHYAQGYGGGRPAMGRGGIGGGFAFDSYRDNRPVGQMNFFHQPQRIFNGGGGGGQMDHQNQHRRGAWGARGGFVPRGYVSRGGRGGAMSDPTRRFEGDYDFEKANQQFMETMNNLKDDFATKTKLSENNKENVENSQSGDDKTVNKEEKPNAAETPTTTTADKKDNTTAGSPSESSYDKQKSFFDHISCEALEILEGVNNNRVNWRRERELNQETFGQVGLHRNFAYRRGGRGGAGFQQNRRGSAGQRYR